MGKARRVSASHSGQSVDNSRAAEPKRAVLYLRVSTPSQVNTDYNPEGISLPAQRDACTLKCAGLGTEIVREFMEPGRTATSIEKRPVFQEMLAWIKEQKNVDYIVVYQFNRMFRNSIDAAITKKELAKYGTRVISTVMDLGEGPEGAMVETILHAVDEYRSKADGADIAYKMAAKAKNGGTIGRAPIGYLNARDTSEGRNIGIVTLDPERAPLVKLAFELYASGDHSLDSLVADLTRRGLQARPSGRHSAGPVSVTKLNCLLRDPYYMGYIEHEDQLFDGRHEALISESLFDQVQAILDDRGVGGARRTRHHHYLKGVLWCGECHKQGIEARMLMQWANGRGGRYQYYFCRGKQDHSCSSRYIESGDIEEAIVRCYGSLQFPDDIADQMRTVMHEALDEEEQASKLLHQQLTTQLVKLDQREENLLDLVAEGTETSAKVRQRLNTIQRQRNQIRQQLEDTGQRLAIGFALIENALKLLHDPQDLYRQMEPEQRRLMNQAFYEKIYVYEDSTAKASFNPPFTDLLRLRNQWKTTTGEVSREDSSEPESYNFLGRGSSKHVMVEIEGLKPSTSALPAPRSNQLSYIPIVHD
jgi:site-specific DNA recombinase